MQPKARGLSSLLGCYPICSIHLKFCATILMMLYVVVFSLSVPAYGDVGDDVAFLLIS